MAALPIRNADFLLADSMEAGIVRLSIHVEMGQFSQSGGPMARCGQSSGALFLAMLMSGLTAPAHSLAADKATEQRDFSILVDGGQAGAYSMSITQRQDDSFVMAASANVRVSYLGGLKVYRYTYNGTETWKAGRLIHLTSASNDDGREFTVSAVPDSEGMRIRTNGRERMARADIWLTTYWHLPDPKFRNGGVPLMDADTGKDLGAQMHLLETRQISVAGKLQNCTHYQIIGDVQAELWYDAQERLIGLKSISDGHRYELVLKSIRP